MNEVRRCNQFKLQTLGSVDNKKENDIMFLFKREAMLYGLQDNEWARIKDSLPGKEVAGVLEIIGNS